MGGVRIGSLAGRKGVGTEQPQGRVLVMGNELESLKECLLGDQTFIPGLFPNAKERGDYYAVGNIQGKPGASLVIYKDGGFVDFADDETRGGNYLELHRQAKGYGTIFGSYDELHKDYNLPPIEKKKFGKKTPPKKIEMPEDRSLPESYGSMDEKIFHRYYFEDGTFAFGIRRTADKKFLPVIPDGKGGKVQKFVGTCFHEPDRRPLYGLPRLLDESVKAVIVVEGEKCAIALNEILPKTMAAVAWAGSMGGMAYTDFSPLFNNDRITYIWPDNDMQGQKVRHELLRKLNRNCTLRMLDVEGRPEKWDAADAIIEEGMGIDELNKFLKEKAKDVTADVQEIRKWEKDTEEDKKNFEKLKKSDHWIPLAKNVDLKRTEEQGKLIQSFQNVVKVLRASRSLTKLWWDDFYNVEFFEVAGRGNPQKMEDNDTSRFRMTLESIHWLHGVSDRAIDKAIEMVAKEDRRYAPRDSLVKWKGEKRMEKFMHTYFGAKDNEYSRILSIYFLSSLVARILKPGEEVHSMVILESTKQGMGKGKALRALVGRKWYRSVSARLDDKDFLQNLKGKLIMEFAEVDRYFKGYDTSLLKALMTEEEDGYRESYGKRTRDVPRPCIFVGTTNKTNYLRDHTGNRRYLPIQVALEHEIDVKAIERDRDQLLAEAVEYVKNNNFWEIIEGEFKDVVEREASKRLKQDDWHDDVSSFLENSTELLVDGFIDDYQIVDFLVGRGQLPEWKKGRETTNRIKNIMKQLDYTCSDKRQKVTINGKRIDVWRFDPPKE